MKKRFLFASALVVSLLLVVTSLYAANPDLLYVKVRNTKLRAAPQQWAGAVSDLRYGDSLQSLSKKGGWHNVQLGGKKGYVHDSALSTRKVVLQASGGVAGGGDDRDVVLAGKGFNKEVEKGYAAKNKSLNYPAVDAMEKITVSDSELAQFVQVGQLAGGN